MTESHPKRFTPAALISEAEALYQKGRCDDGIDLLLAARRQLPQELRFPVKLAELLLDSERFEDALSVLADLPDPNSSPELLALRGHCEVRLGDYQRAAGRVEQILSLDDRDAAAYTLKGIIAHRRGLLDEAEKCFRLAINNQPVYGEPYKELGLLKKARGDLVAALELLQQGFERSPLSRPIVLAYHTELCAQGQYAPAERAFVRAVGRHPDNQRLRYLTVDILLRRQDYRRAMAQIETCLVRFGPDPGLLSAALQVRRRVDGQAGSGPMGPGASISLCMITKNEENHLSRCLASVKALADEIIVVDTGSKDHTKTVARVFGASVFDFEWCADFAAARNYGLSKAKGDWILILDADEVLAGGDLDRLRSMVQGGSGAPVAYSIMTRNYTLQANLVGWTANDGRYETEAAGNGWYPSEKVRLFPNDARIRFSYPIHELVEPSIKAAGIAIRKCPVPVHHYGKLNGQKTDEKALAYYALGKKKLDQLGDNLPALREMAVQAASLEKYDEAADLWQRFLSMEPNCAEAYVNLGTACWNAGDYARAAQYAEKAITLAPEFKEAHFNSAQAHLYLGDASRTIAILEKLLKKNQRYLAARFMLAAAYACAAIEDKARSGFDDIRKSLSSLELDVAVAQVSARLENANLHRFVENLNCFARAGV